MMYGDFDDDDSSDDSSDFLSPFAQFRRSSRRSSGERVSTPWNGVNTPRASPNETLARVQDTSWIGASVSPIVSFDDEEDLEQHTAPYRRALKDSFDANERSALLGDSLYRIHPLWNEDGHNNSSNSNNYGSTKSKGGNSPPVINTASLHSRKRDNALFFKCHWILLLSFVSALHFSTMAIYDAFWWYHAYRRAMRGGDNAASSSSSSSLAYWNWWWLSPPSSTLTKFGALVPWKVLLLGEYWRVLASSLISTCFYEWILVIWAWRALHFGRSGQWRCAATFWLSLLTGQLWMMAWDVEGVAGCFTWGTCGVLCAVGAAKPPQRFNLYVIAILFILVSLLEPNNSVIGISGSCFFGWVYYGAGLTRFDSHHNNNKRNHAPATDKSGRGVGTSKTPPLVVVSRLFCGIVLLALWVVPILWIAFQFPLTS